MSEGQRVNLKVPVSIWSDQHCDIYHWFAEMYATKTIVSASNAGDGQDGHVPDASLIGKLVGLLLQGGGAALSALLTSAHYGRWSEGPT